MNGLPGYGSVPLQDLTSILCDSRDCRCANSMHVLDCIVQHLSDHKA